MSTPGALTAPLASLRQVAASGEGSAISGYLSRGKKGKRHWKKLWFVIKGKVLYTYAAREVAWSPPSLLSCRGRGGASPRTGRAGPRRAGLLCGAPRRRTAASQLPGAGRCLVGPSGRRGGQGRCREALARARGGRGAAVQGAARKRAPFCPPLPLLGPEPKSVSVHRSGNRIASCRAALLLKKPDVHVHHNILDFDLLR